MFYKGLEFLIEKKSQNLITITQRNEYVGHQFDLTHKYIKMIYTSHLSIQSS